MKCPSCGIENLQGADECEGCFSPLFHVEEAGARDDIARIMKDPIQKVSLRDPIIVSPESSVFEVIRTMKLKKRGCALVVEGSFLLGIFTERDAIQKLSDPNMDLRNIEIQHMMTSSPEVLKETDSLAFAINKMAVGSFRHVPLRRANGSFAVMSVRDILRHFF